MENCLFLCCFDYIVAVVAVVCASWAAMSVAADFAGSGIMAFRRLSTHTPSVLFSFNPARLSVHLDSRLSETPFPRRKSKNVQRNTTYVSSHDERDRHNQTR